MYTYHIGLCFLNSNIHENVKSEGHLIYVGDVDWLDVLFSDFVLTVREERAQLFFVILWQLV